MLYELIMNLYYVLFIVYNILYNNIIYLLCYYYYTLRLIYITWMCHPKWPKHWLLLFPQSLTRFLTMQKKHRGIIKQTHTAEHQNTNYKRQSGEGGRWGGSWAERGTQLTDINIHWCIGCLIVINPSLVHVAPAFGFFLWLHEQGYINPDVCTNQFILKWSMSWQASVESEGRGNPPIEQSLPRQAKCKGVCTSVNMNEYTQLPTANRYTRPHTHCVAKKFSVVLVFGV